MGPGVANFWFLYHSLHPNRPAGLEELAGSGACGLVCSCLRTTLQIACGQLLSLRARTWLSADSLPAGNFKPAGYGFDRNSFVCRQDFSTKSITNIFLM